MIRFFTDEYISQKYCDDVRIPIIDDHVNEADQVFVIQLSLEPGVLNEDPITLSRDVSLVQIKDNDREYTIDLYMITVFSLPIIENKISVICPITSEILISQHILQMSLRLSFLILCAMIVCTVESKLDGDRNVL